MVSKTERDAFLFSLRIWVEPGEGQRLEWRGKLQALPDGEAYYFNGGTALVERLETMLRSRHAAGDHFPLQNKGDKT